jgi:hypothetical protein
MLRTTLVIGVIGTAACQDAHANEAAPCQVHVILFVPADVKPPKEYQRRIDDIVECAESFFQRELRRWGHEKVVMPFRRKSNGRVEVTMVRGKSATSQYKPVPVRMEVMDVLRRQRKLDGGRQIWWIMVYPGEPPARFASFLGGFGQEIGGWSVCNLDTTPGRIDPEAPLGSPFLEKLALKGMLHELGHGFRLPHIGPLDRDGASNTLMGPTHNNYRRVRPRGAQKVHLSEAEAAMLSIHPAFRGASDERSPLPKLEVMGLECTVRPREKAIVVTGRLRAPQRAAFALVADESDARPGEYWTKTYVGKVSADGAFEAVVTEPSESNGILKIWFAFEDGSQTGDGRSRGRESGIAKSYTFKQNRWTFK